MNIRLSIVLFASAVVLSCGQQRGIEKRSMFVIAPGHFHAALIQKNMLPGVSDTVKVYAPEGAGLDIYLETVKSFGQRKDNPTSWVESVYAGSDYLQKLPFAGTGDFVVLAGNNRLKASYILEAVKKGYNVLSDKPLAISKEDYGILSEAFSEAEANGLIVMELMTERFDPLNQIANALANDKAFFGEWKSVKMSSTHHFYKYVAGSPLRRPSWYYDVSQQGEGIADVTTHLIDQVFTAVSTGCPVDSQDVSLKEASHWPTVITKEMFYASTGEKDFPGFLEKYVDGDKLYVYSNGKISFSVGGVPVEIEVQWDYEAPPGGGDTSTCLFEGSEADVYVVQDSSSDFNRRLVVSSVEDAVYDAVDRLRDSFPFLEIVRIDDGHFLLQVPANEIGSHEERFNLVARKFLKYLDGEPLPREEMVNTLTKYKLTIDAIRKASKR